MTCGKSMGSPFREVQEGDHSAGNVREAKQNQPPNQMGVFQVPMLKALRLEAEMAATV